MRSADLGWMLALSIAALLVLGKDISSGALADADSAAHIMDGVLIHDWVMAGPAAWREPLEFARRQYAHYPTLGIGRHYPPAFAAVEAAFFAVFGISEASARLCVAFFGVAMVLGAYLFVRAIADRLTAAMSGVILLAFPATTLWGRQTMLEIPTLAALVWAAAAFLAYTARPTKARLVLMLACGASTILFKQTAVFLVCAIALVMLVQAARKVAPLTHAVTACVAAAAALAAVVFSFDDACFKTLSGYSTYADPLSVAALTFYARATPYLTGALILLPATLGAVLCLRRRDAGAALLICWVAVAYIMVTAASLKVPRFFYVALFPLAVWAAMGVQHLLALLPAARLRYAATAAAVALLSAIGFLRPVRQTPDFGPVVAAHRTAIADQAVLFSGLRDGDFIFQVRRQLPWRNPVVIRGSKLLYTCTAGPDLDLVSYADTQEQVYAVMRRFAFEFVFVERENVVGTNQDQWLRRYLADSGEYRLLATYALERTRCDLPGHVDVYRLAVPMVRSVDYFEIPMPRTGKPIRVSLNRQNGDVDGSS